jgi:hypothetical protein
MIDPTLLNYPVLTDLQLFLKPHLHAFISRCTFQLVACFLCSMQ